MRVLGRGFTVRAVLAVIIAALLFPAVTVTPAAAAPLEQQACQITAFRQHDMAGTFVSAASQMRLEIYPCGGSFLMWDNVYGTHTATYYSTNRIPGGGVAATKLSESLQSLDGQQRIGYKPAEPGFIQVITITPYGEILGVYRLMKIG